MVPGCQVALRLTILNRHKIWVMGDDDRAQPFFLLSIPPSLIVLKSLLCWLTIIEEWDGLMSTFGSSRSPRFFFFSSRDTFRPSLSRLLIYFSPSSAKLPGEICFDQTTHLCLMYVCLLKWAAKQFNFVVIQSTLYRKIEHNNRISNIFQAPPHVKKSSNQTILCI